MTTDGTTDPNDMPPDSPPPDQPYGPMPTKDPNPPVPAETEPE